MKNTIKLAITSLVLTFSSAAFAVSPDEVKQNVIQTCKGFETLSVTSLEKMSVDAENVYRLLASLSGRGPDWADPMLLEMMNELSTTKKEPLKFGEYWFEQCKTRGFDDIDKISSRQ